MSSITNAESGGWPSRVAGYGVRVARYELRVAGCALRGARFIENCKSV
jgi:hypothetical protein